LERDVRGLQNDRGRFGPVGGRYRIQTKRVHRVEGTTDPPRCAGPEGRPQLFDSRTLPARHSVFPGGQPLDITGDDAFLRLGEARSAAGAGRSPSPSATARSSRQGRACSDGLEVHHTPYGSSTRCTRGVRPAMFDAGQGVFSKWSVVDPGTGPASRPASTGLAPCRPRRLARPPRSADASGHLPMESTNWDTRVIARIEVRLPNPSTGTAARPPRPTTGRGWQGGETRTSPGAPRLRVDPQGYRRSDALGGLGFALRAGKENTAGADEAFVARGFRGDVRHARVDTATTTRHPVVAAGRHSRMTPRHAQEGRTPAGLPKIGHAVEAGIRHPPAWLRSAHQGRSSRNALNRRASAG